MIRAIEESDFCRKISIKYPSSPINTRPGGFVLLSDFHGVFSFGMKNVNFFSHTLAVLFLVLLACIISILIPLSRTGLWCFAFLTTESR